MAIDCRSVPDDETLIEWVDGDAPVAFERRLERREAIADGPHLFARLIQRHAAPQPADGAEPVVAARHLVRREHDRLPEAGIDAIEAAGRQNPDDLVRLAIEHDVAMQNIWIACEPALPHRVGEDDDAVGAWLILAWQEGAAERGLHAEDGEEVGRDHHARDSRGIALSGQRGVEPSGGRERLERRAQSLPVDEVERADPVARRWRRRFPHPDHPFRLGIGQRLQQHRVHETEHRRVRADADRHDADGHDRKARITLQEEQTVAEVLGERFDPPNAAAIAVLFPDALDAAEAAAGGAARLLWRQPGRARVPFGHLEMRLHLVVELAIEAAGADERQQAAKERARRHDLASRNLATSAVARSQFATSTRSWRVPAAVSE